MDYLGLRPHQMGVGNVYYVIQATHGEVAELTDYQEKTYLDGSSAVHTTVATALTASQAERNDYIVIRPDNDFYANAATLTMDKNDVHLIAPDGFGKTGLGNFRTVLQETGSAILLTITGNGVEVGGFFFAGKSGYSIMTFGSGTVWSAYIHDNYFGMNASNGDTGNYGIYSGGALNSFCIRDNTFSNFSPGTMTSSDCAIAAFILTSAGATRGLIKDNIFFTGANTAVAQGISIDGYSMIVDGNLFWENPSHGPSVEAGTFTQALYASAGSLVTRNLIGMAAQANAIEGAATDGIIANYASTATGGELTYTGATT